ncbi:hypothetical protein [Aurantiacibacter aquimixticola]|nr:hypothetical protein [Aurantiacibacter aquimixticola]
MSMRYVPDKKPEATLKDHLGKWFMRIAFFLLFSPFVIVFLLGLTGEPIPEGAFGTWFMGALTVAGLVTSWDMFRSVKRHGASELGCALPIAAVTCWWGWIFLRDLGAFE